MIGFLFRDLRGSAALRALWIFAASLFLGVFLVAVCAGLLRLVQGGLAADAQARFGGDIEIDAQTPLEADELAWIGERGTLSHLIELRTMLGSASGDFTVVELQTVDAAYPLYGEVRLEPELPLQRAVEQNEAGVWGAVFDPVLADQIDLSVGDAITVGALTLELRAMVVEQPDRSLSADVRGPPLLVDPRALDESGLAGVGSVVDHEYRVRLDADTDPAVWRDELLRAFPEAIWDVRTVLERGEFIGRRLDQVASVLLLIGFCTLLIGGLGIANSIAAWLRTKRRTLATLQSLGARQRQLAFTYVGQVVVMAAVASGVGAAMGSLVAWLIAGSLAERFAIDRFASGLALSAGVAAIFGIGVALVFSLPPLGRALASRPARLIRGGEPVAQTPRGWTIAAGLCLLATLALLLILVPEPLVALGFVAIVALLLVLLDALVSLLGRLALRFGHTRWLEGRFALRLAIASLHRPDSALRPLVLSLGVAATLVVGASLVIAATLQALNGSIPERAPALVLYDVADERVGDFRQYVESLAGYRELTLAPLVLGRLTTVNGLALAEDDDVERALEANDEQKLSYRVQGVDNVELAAGAWWEPRADGAASVSSASVSPASVSYEDREAAELGLEVGDVLGFDILGERVEATLAAIHSQARFETSFWLEAIFSDGVLEPFITRHVGSVFLDPGQDLSASAGIARNFPGVVVIRTEKVLASVRSILGSAAAAVTAIAATSLLASILVMASVVAVARDRQVFEASVLNALGARRRVVLWSVVHEYALVGLLLILFASVFGGLIAAGLLGTWLKLPADDVRYVGPLAGALVVGACLSAGVFWLARSLEARPALLLRRE